MNIFDTVKAFFQQYSLLGWILPPLVLLLFLLLIKPITEFIFHLISFAFKKSQKSWFQEIKRVFAKPLRLLLGLTALFIVLRTMPYFYQSKTFWSICVKCFRCAVIISAAWALYRLEDSTELMESSVFKKLDFQSNSILFPFLSKALRFITVAIAILIIAQEWNYSVSGLLAGLGLGGLAFALAAKDMLSNIFGGVVILLDKPFSIGDWIKTDDVEGTVEDITFRSVRVRTFSQAVVTVPNTKMVDQPITNFSRMGKRRVSFSLGLSFATSASQMKRCEEKIRDLLRQNGELEKETAVVAFDSIGENSLNLLVSFFTITTDSDIHLKIKEEIYYGILDILSSEQVELSYPALRPLKAKI